MMEEKIKDAEAAEPAVNPRSDLPQDAEGGTLANPIA
jgi:hypothetical protein